MKESELCEVDRKLLHELRQLPVREGVEVTTASMMVAELDDMIKQVRALPKKGEVDG